MLKLDKKNDKELEDILSDKREALRTFRFSSSGTKTRNVKEGGNLKKDIARILTEMTKRNKSINETQGK